MTLACKGCGSEDTEVLHTDHGPRGIKRRRQCHQCKTRFTTLEVLEQSSRFGRKKSYSHLLDLYWELHLLLSSAGLLEMNPRKKI